MTTSATPSTRPSPPRLPGRLPIAAGALLGVLAGLLADAGTSGIAVGLTVGALAVAAGIPDGRERRIPNVVVVTGAGAAVAIAVPVALAGDPAVIGRLVAGTALGGGLLLALHLARPEGLGFGDVKLAAALGGVLGVVHWTLIAIALGAAALLGSTGAVVRRGWRRSIPFGACLGVGAVAAVASAAWWRNAGLWGS